MAANMRSAKAKKADRPVSRRKRPSPQAGMRSNGNSQAIVVRAPAPKPWLLTQDEVSLLKNAVCKGATDEELKYCLAVARRYELDPFQKQIWFVPRWDAKAQDSDGTEGGKVYVPVVGIDGLLHIASTHHADFGTFSEPQYGPMIEVTYEQWLGPKGHRQVRQAKLKVPEWCRIEAWKKGCTQPTVAKVWWEEIYPNVDKAPLVRRMPRLMLAKCAKAQALRTAYPKTGGLLIPEETQTREFTDITPGGRLMTPERQVVECQPCGRTNGFENCYEANCPMLTLEQRKERNDKRAQAELEKLKAKSSREEGPAKAGAGQASNAKPGASAQKKPDAPSEATQPTGDTHPALFYALTPSGSYDITGADELKKANRDLLLELWSPVAQCIMATPAQLGKLISQFEKRKVPFRDATPMREPGQ